MYSDTPLHHLFTRIYPSMAIEGLFMPEAVHICHPVQSSWSRKHDCQSPKSKYRQPLFSCNNLLLPVKALLHLNIVGRFLNWRWGRNRTWNRSQEQHDVKEIRRVPDEEVVMRRNCRLMGCICSVELCDGERYHSTDDGGRIGDGSRRRVLLDAKPSCQRSLI